MKEIGNAEVVKEIPQPKSTKTDIKIKPEGNITREEADRIYEEFEKSIESDGKTDEIKPEIILDEKDKEAIEYPYDETERHPGDKMYVDNGADETGEKEVKEEEKNAEKEETAEKKGGSYGDVKNTSDGETHEVHHMPADKVSNLDKDDGPAIKMEKEDHRRTASWGRSREAQEYRERQKELIEQGKFREAIQMDIDDIHEKFGDKYDDAIAEMMEYVDKLEEEGKING